MEQKGGGTKKFIKVGVVVGKKILSVAEMILLELIEEAEDMEYMRTHCYAVIGRDVRSARYESEEGRRCYEIKMKRQAIERLRRQKFVKLRREGERIICELTNNGRIHALQMVILSSTEYFYDRRLCLVSFDFPEAARASRNMFRKFIKGAGFRFVQGSVWMAKKNVAPALEEVVRLLKVERWVEVYTASK